MTCRVAHLIGHHYGRPQRRILDAMSKRPMAIVPLGELVDAAYGDDPAGGPICAPESVRNAIRRLRRHGHQIKIHHGRGYSLDPREPLPFGTLDMRGMLHGAMARCLQDRRT